MDENVRCDLHVHSRFSTDSGNFALRRARLGESYTDPERVYRVCKKRGMRFVTISDHNTLEGALRISHLADTFLSVEVTTRFAEDEVPLHVLVWNLTEEDHRDLQPVRPSVVELAAFLRERRIAHALAHPLYQMGPRLTPSHMERLMEIFSVWEGRNGARPEESNTLACRLAGLAGVALTGGSDDHGAIDIATTWTEAPGETVEEFLAAVCRGEGQPGGAHGSTVKLAHALAALAANAYREGGHTLSPLVAGQLRGLFDDDADDANERHEEITQASRRLTQVLGSRVRTGGMDINSIGTRLSALVAAAAVQVPYLGTAHHHAGSRSSLDAIDAAFFGVERTERELKALVFTDTFDEANGVAGTMRRLATEGAHGVLPLRVATARAEAGGEPGLIEFPPDWALPLPTYEELQLRFPLIIDVLAEVERQQPDVIHLATPGPVGVCGLVAARLLDIPIVGSYHTELGPYTLHLTCDLLVAQAMDLWVDWFYRQCKLVLAPTHAVADGLRARGLANVAVWGRGVDAHRFTPRRRNEALRDYLLGNGSVLLLSVGRLSNEKRIDVLLDAFGRLRERTPEARLAIVGDGPARADLEASAGEGVTFLGELRGDGLAHAYASCDIFCFPSTTDTFGQVILEASASGLPVVAADTGGAPELVRHRQTGLLFRPDDAAALADALVELVEDIPFRLALGRHALAQAQRRSWAASYAELLAGYAAVTRRAPVAHPIAA
jgi:glycosyltransferase involved in cell wall biosynthesis/predicted metal-dependent phosphoesterase TrpH